MARISVVILICFFLFSGLSFSMPPEELGKFKGMNSQVVADDDLCKASAITGEALVGIIKGMVDFSIPGSSIVFNRRTGQIFVKQTPSNQRDIEHIITRMREASFKQVEIEARIVTIGADEYKGLTADLAELTYADRIRGTNFSVGEKADFTSFVNGLDDTNYGGQFSTYAFTNTVLANLYLDMLQKSTKTNTLAAPKITVFNNQRAHIKIEKRENYIAEVDSDIEVSDNDNADITFTVTTTIGQAQSGTILDVTPTINSDGTITLVLHPHYVTVDLTNTESIVNVDTNGNDFSNTIVLPVATSQKIDTSLTLPNGGVAVLGGLIKEEEIKTKKKTPILGDMPLFGKLLFTRETVSDEQVYLLIFVKAKVKEAKKK